MSTTNTQAVAPPSQFWDGENAICPYCHSKALFAQAGHPIYPYRRDYGPVWACPQCDSAHVGCHPKTNIPLGRLADESLRVLKKEAHFVFDPLWRGKIAIEGCRPYKARKLGYTWLAAQLGIHVDDCHIGWFDEEQCLRVIEVCTPYSKIPNVVGNNTEVAV